MSEQNVKPERPVTSPAKFKPPANSVDCHAHVYGPFSKFPLAGTRAYSPFETPLDQYMRKQQILGFDRGVLTQPSHYGTDNACLLDALAQAGDSLRGIVVLNVPSLTDSEIARLTEAGVCGIRVSEREFGGPSLDDIEALGERLKGSGWHLELVPPKRAIEPLAALRPRLEKLPIPAVFDGMACPVIARGLNDPSFQSIVGMVRDGVAWVKLSHPYHLDDMPYAGALPYAQALVAANPNRCVFGLDWPHPGHQPHPPLPDDGFLLDLFPQWVPDPKLQKLILVDTAAELYRF